MTKKQWLAYYSQQFSSVEVNSSFYHLPSENSLQNWKDNVPDEFVFSVKASRLITHLKRLNNVEEALATFLSRVRLLGPKLGPILYQLPASFERNDLRLGSFLQLLPADLHHVFEFRSPTWFVQQVYDLLQRYAVGFCSYHMAGTASPLLALGDVAYFRFHGGQGLYQGSYSRGELEVWAQNLIRFASSKSELYVFFNNDAGGYAVTNAIELNRIMQGEDPQRIAHGGMT